MENEIKLMVPINTCLELQNFNELLTRAADMTIKQRDMFSKLPLILHKFSKCEETVAKHRWHRTTLPSDNTTFNYLSIKMMAEIRKFKNEFFVNFVKQLSPSGKDDYFLWKIAKRIRKSTTSNTC